MINPNLPFPDSIDQIINISASQISKPVMVKAQTSGLQGIQGNSAYQVALANGFVGTESQWLASLKGEKGDTIYVGNIDGGAPDEIYTGGLTVIDGGAP